MFFRLSPYVENMTFCNISEIEQNVRLKILQLRDQHEIEFDGTVIPNRIKEIPFNILDEYKRRVASEKGGSIEEDDNSEDEGETGRSLGKKYLRQVHVKIFQKCKNSDNNLEYESVVNEKYLIYFELMVKTVLRNFLNWFRWQPKINKPLPIKTAGLEDKSTEGHYKIKNQINVIIKIHSGQNIPNRTSASPENEGSQNLRAESAKDEVNPFVEISYENLSVRTSACRGGNPVWNETLMLPLEKKFIWLGGTDVLLSAICYSNSMEGSFKIKLPEILLGYETEVDKQKTKSPKHHSYPLHTFLQMELKIEPNIPKLTPNMQLLRFMLGSIIDHAVALTCYLLALKMDVWLVLGYGIPNGYAAYVLVREYAKETETPNYYIYDVAYNEKYNVTDVFCPLHSIYCLVNGENIWANTQRSDNVGTTRFDLSRKSDWLPLFTNNISAPIYFLNNKISYKSGNDVGNLEIQLERKIRKKIAKLRQLDRTIWNSNLGNMFKNILKSFEVNSMYNKNHFETLTEIKNEISSYNVIGYILNTAFTSLSNILKKVKSLGIHIQEEGNTEFALAIYIHVYPGQLLSIWIFIANATEKDIIF
ncbi:hypothetical protein NQ318_015785 [Aromia moschata]|uniref:C2 domain-containing protein n=1 Tax=Aromia moschata TaxID=1265417 RepID=A0AAV8XAW5_9CUCU|nr:hypothetical protein NQ318_015785 [Aromia moschata]